jgi:hypothetical protein
LSRSFHFIHLWRPENLCMFQPVTINSRDIISSQSNGTVNLPSLGVEFLGPNSLSVFISAIETGIIIVLFARFFVRKRERLAIQILVYFVTLVAMYVAFEQIPHCKYILTIFFN